MLKVWIDCAWIWSDLNILYIKEHLNVKMWVFALQYLSNYYNFSCFYYGWMICVIATVHTFACFANGPPSHLTNIATATSAE